MGDKYIMRNCYWRNEYQDMNATVPTCDYYGQYGSCPCSDECEHYISEQEVESIIRKRTETEHSHEDGQWFDLTDALTVERNEWIPFTRRPMTEEEQKNYPNCTFIFDCDLPDDGGEILVSNGRFVWMDTFCIDIDGCYLDGGDDIDEDMAWMPLPKPYREDGEV